MNFPNLTESEIAGFIAKSTADVFATMLGLDVEAGEPRAGRSAATEHTGLVVALGLTGTHRGSGQLLLHPSLACRIASAMLMDDFKEMNNDVADAVAETANMIVGNIKNCLEDKLGDMGLSTPAVVYGGEFEARTAGDPEWVIVPFRCEGEDLLVQLMLTESRAHMRFHSPALAGATVH